MENKALKFYEALLKSLNIEVRGMGLYMKIGTSESQFIIGGKELVLPTMDNLRNLNHDTQMVFHPLSENIFKSESKLLSRIRTLIVTRCNYIFYGLMAELSSIFLDEKKVNKLVKEQLKLVSSLTNIDIDHKFVDNLLKLLESGNNDAPLLHLYIKKGGTYQNVKHLRVVVPTFPLLEHLREDPKKYKFRVKDLKIAETLYELILPGSTTNPESYGDFSDSKMAPGLQALLRSYAKFASCFNDIIDTFSDVLEKKEDIYTAPDVFELIDGIDNMSADIRAIGDFNYEEPEKQPVVNTTQNIQQPQFQQPIVTTPTNKSAQKTSNGKLDFAYIKENNPYLNYLPPISNDLAQQDFISRSLNLMQQPTLVPQYPQQPTVMQQYMIPQYPQQPLMLPYPQPMIPQYPQPTFPLYSQQPIQPTSHSNFGFTFKKS